VPLKFSSVLSLARLRSRSKRRERIFTGDKSQRHESPLGRYFDFPKLRCPSELWAWQTGYVGLPHKFGRSHWRGAVNQRPAGDGILVSGKTLLPVA